jgi:EAL domain-containing protein (putative c-di-GMP-specific phosphodiesterase class I)/AmiR/NasT family two-component response regulator
MTRSPQILTGSSRPGTGLSALRFLVAEDNEFQRALLLEALRDLGVATIHEASDGQAALEILQDPARPVDIVITDLQMPGMDGMEFVRRLGQAGIDVSVIVASSLDRRLLASIGSMSRAYGIQLLGVLEKPLTPDSLEPLIALHRSRHAAEVAPPDPGCVPYTPSEVAQGLAGDQFEPFFQPKIELATGRVVGAEALARWQHAQHGVIAPGAFIACMEEHGLVQELSWIMLRKTAALWAAWRAAGLEGTVAVNLSVHSLLDPTTAERVTHLVRSQGLEPKSMIIEVTESAAAGESGEALENLARLRMNGFGLSIDDYGTGYSSLQQLTRIAFTELKIDQSFVREAVREKAPRAILESSIRLARELKLTSVAEGVETREGCEMLRRLGCDLAQGYLFAKPMRADVFPEWARHWQPAPAA